MISLPVRAVSACAIGLSACYGHAEIITVRPYPSTNWDRPTVNFGSPAVPTVCAGSEAGGFLQFDVSSLGGQVIASATLNLDVAEIRRGAGGAVELRVVEPPGSQDGLTFDNQPAFGAPLATLPIFDPDAGGTVSVGITSIVRGWVDGSIPNCGLALTTYETDSITVFPAGNAASIDVHLANELEIAPAQVELRWIPPSTRSDGSALSLSEIGGYILQVNGQLFSDQISAEAVVVAVDNLLPGDYCFELATRDIEGRIGPFSDAQCWSVRPAPAQP